MNKLLFLVVSLTILFCACQRSTKTIEEKLVYENLNLKEEVFLFGNKKHLGGTLTMNLTYPSFSEEQKNVAFQKILSPLFWGEEYEGLILKDASEKFVSSFRMEKQSMEEDYNFLLDYWKEEGKPEQCPDSLNYERNLSNRFYYDKNGLLSFQMTEYVFWGGAHGGQSKKGYLLTNQGECLTEKDIFIENYYDALKEILIQKFLTQNNVKTLDELSELGYINTDGILPNDNFYMTDEGLVYIFGEYEIACYAIGISEVFLPFTEIKHLLKLDSPLAPIL